jgi:sulfite exporter TauE/SafE
MDILIAYVFITTGLFMMVLGLLKTVEKIQEIEMYIDRINKRLDDAKVAETKEVSTQQPSS